jgi:hypothetical protein
MRYHGSNGWHLLAGLVVFLLGALSELLRVNRKDSE